MGKGTTRAAVICAIGLSSYGCNERNPVLDQPAEVAPSGPTPSVATHVTAMALVFDPPAVMSGASTRGRISLTQPAPPGGTVVTLTSEDPAVAMPASVTVPTGVHDAAFAVTVRQVPTDRHVVISASTAELSVKSALSVWAVLPTFVSYIVEITDDSGRRTPFTRLTPENASFSAWCGGNVISVQARSATESLIWRFGAPGGRPLRVGAYEEASRLNFPTRPLLDVGGCGSTTTGRFVVHEIEVTATGTVRRFWVTFDDRCDFSQRGVKGDVRLTGVPHPGTFTSSCVAQ